MKKIIIILMLLVISTTCYAQEEPEIYFKIKIVAVEQIGEQCRVDFQILNAVNFPLAPIMTSTFSVKDVTGAMLRENIERLCTDYIESLTMESNNKIQSIKNNAVGNIYTVYKEVE